MASEACCAAGPPIERAYAGEGAVEEVDGVRVYVTGSVPVGEGGKALVLIYDIFGFGEPPANGNVRRYADRLAAAGFFVIMPDFFRGNPWDLENFPPPDKEAFGEWWSTVASTEVVQADLNERFLPFLAERGATSLGVIGFCWGGLQACTLASTDTFKGVASVHGARLTAEHAEAAQVPMLLMPAADDAPIDPLVEVLQGKPFADKCVHKTFSDEVHGFCAARGDWSTSTGAAADEAIQMTIDFFNSVL